MVSKFHNWVVPFPNGLLMAFFNGGLIRNEYFVISDEGEHLHTTCIYLLASPGGLFCLQGEGNSIF